MTINAAGPSPLGQLPFLAPVMRIEPAWIDYNGHLNIAYYSVLFDRGVDAIWPELGVGPDYKAARGGSTFAVECHIRYLREIHVDDPVQVSVLLVAADDKRLHLFQELRHATDGWLSATCEGMSVHVDMATRKVAPFPADVRARIAGVLRAHDACPRPKGLGRKIGMRAK